MTRLLFLASLVCLGACSTPPSTGIATLRISELPGACNVETNSVAAGAGYPGIPVIVQSGDYVRHQAVMGILPSERWAGGHLSISAWQAEDGTVGRLYLEFSPERGFGATYSPTTSLPGAEGFARPWYQQPTALGYTEWTEGVRTFSAIGYSGFVTYLSTGSGRRDPADIHAELAIEGIDASGRRTCRIVAMRGLPATPWRTPFSPRWLRPSPGAMIVDGLRQTSPLYEGDEAPDTTLLQPSEAPLLNLALPEMRDLSPAMLAFNAGGDGGGGCGCGD